MTKLGDTALVNIKFSCHVNGLIFRCRLCRYTEYTGKPLVVKLFERI